MSNFTLNQTGGTDIQTTFRFEIHIDPAKATDVRLGLDEKVVGYIQSCSLPVAPGEPITWHLPGGMKNFQAGKRTVRPIDVTFVVPTTHNQGSIYRMLERWADSTYNLNNGTNIGKANYCSDAISILLKGEDDHPRYEFALMRAQVTQCDYGEVDSEANSLIKVSATFIYDNYYVYGYTGGARTLLGHNDRGAGVI